MCSQDEGELHTAPGAKPHLVAITGLHDIEEDIWSPKWGLKGKVDASVQASISRDSSQSQPAEEHVAPLEIKTGRSVGVMAHRAQTMLYTLLMEDRYSESPHEHRHLSDGVADVPVPAGLLYYSQLNSILRVEAKPNEIRALIIARNELADYLSRKRMTPSTGRKRTQTETETADPAFLPPTIDHPGECRTCYAVDSCMLYRKVGRILPDSV